MYDIKLLEEEWKRYKKKKRKPLYAFIFSILILGTLAFFFLNYKNVIVSKFENNKSIVVDKPKPSVILLDSALTTLEVKKEIIEKSIVEKSTNDNNVEIETDDSSTIDDPMRYKHPNAKKVSITVTEVIKKPVIVEKPRKKMHLNIIETTSASAYKDVAKRFADTSDTDDSLFLARTYYEKGNNKKAIYWALKTNKVNSNIEESWLIFAKAKARSGHKSEAIRILSSYIKRSNSVDAKALLKKLKK
jgi:tetratricopeptide (TPR) repeat protein